MGIIAIRDLKINCIVGLYPHERKVQQDIFVDLDLHLDFTQAAATDNLEHTLDYTELAAWLEEWIQTEKFMLIETLAEHATTQILQRWPAVKKCRIEIKKPGALAKASFAAVIVERAVS